MAEHINQANGCRYEPCEKNKNGNWMNEINQVVSKQVNFIQSVKYGRILREHASVLTSKIHSDPFDVEILDYRLTNEVLNFDAICFIPTDIFSQDEVTKYFEMDMSEIKLQPQYHFGGKFYKVNKNGCNHFITIFIKKERMVGYEWSKLLG